MRDTKQFPGVGNHWQALRQILWLSANLILTFVNEVKASRPQKVRSLRWSDRSAISLLLFYEFLSTTIAFVEEFVYSFQASNCCTQKFATLALHDCVRVPPSPILLRAIWILLVLLSSPISKRGAAGPTYGWGLSSSFGEVANAENCGEFSKFIATLAYQIAISIPETPQYIERAVLVGGSSLNSFIYIMVSEI